MANIEGVRLPGIHAGREQTSADALARARRLVEGAAVRGQDAADAVELSGLRGVAGAETSESPIARIGSLLSLIQNRVALMSTLFIPDSERPAVQAEIDEALDLIDRLAVAQRLDRAPLFGGVGTVNLTDVDAKVDALRVYNTSLAPGETVNLDVVVTQSAQTAALWLDFGGSHVNLSQASERFVISIAGSDGAREFSFASGTSIAAVVDAINTFTYTTGVLASATSLGVVSLISSNYGRSEFVSVRVLDDGGIDAGAGGGVYRAIAGDSDRIDPGSRIRWDEAESDAGITDYGQNLLATLNGNGKEVEGLEILDRRQNGVYSVALTVKAAQTLGAFRAAVLTGDQFAGVGDSPSDALSPIGGGTTRDLVTGVLGRTRTVQGEEPYRLRDLRSGRALSALDGDLLRAQQSIRRAQEEWLQFLRAGGAGREKQASGAEAEQTATLSDPAGAAAEVRRTLFSRSWQTILAAIGGAPRADRFG